MDDGKIIRNLERFGLGIGFLVFFSLICLIALAIWNAPLFFLYAAIVAIVAWGIGWYIDTH